jgi:hypothetical protein
MERWILGIIFKGEVFVEWQVRRDFYLRVVICFRGEVSGSSHG